MNSLSPRKLLVLKAVADYYTLTRALIQMLVGVRNDRVMRALLQELCGAGLLQKTRMHVVNPKSGAPAPVYFPSRRGIELVAAEFEDERYLRTCTRTPDWQHLYHWVDLSTFHIRLDQAVSRQSIVILGGWLGEWDERDPQAGEPGQRFTLYTLIREKPRLVCAPDAAFSLKVGPHAKTYYLELDRGTSGIQQIAHSKTAGYAAMAAAGLHRRHFETTAEAFTVLHVSPSAGRRDLLRKAIRTKDGAALHKFTTWNQWMAEDALHAPIFFSGDGDESQPLIRPPQGAAS